MQTSFTHRVGLWASIILAVLGAVYLALLIGFFSIEGFTFPPTPFVMLIGGLVTIISAPAILVIFTAILHLAPREKRILGSLGVCFAALFVMAVSINRFTQLTVIRLAPGGSATPDLARFLPYSTDSVMFAMEILGWGLFLSLAALFAAPLFGGTRLQKAIRWLLLVFAVFSLMSVIGFATNTPLTAGGFVAWGPVLLALAILFAVFFKGAEPAGYLKGLETKPCLKYPTYPIILPMRKARMPSEAER